MHVLLFQAHAHCSAGLPPAVISLWSFDFAVLSIVVLPWPGRHNGAHTTLFELDSIRMTMIAHPAGIQMTV